MIKVKDFIKFGYPTITQSVQFYQSLRKAHIFPRVSLGRNRAGASDDLRLSGR
jgi:hypothetical protein